jgi:hypothetical protein
VADGEGAARRSIRLARAYEWTFWALVAVLIVTGIGNVAAYGRGIPGPSTEWGLVLTLKLVGVIGLLVLSVVRSLLVERALPRGTVEADGPDPRGGDSDRRGDPDRRDGAERNSLVGRRLGRAYALTGVYLAGVVVLAEVLAHG